MSELRDPTGWCETCKKALFPFKPGLYGPSHPSHPRDISPGKCPDCGKRTIYFRHRRPPSAVAITESNVLAFDNDLIGNKCEICEYLQPYRNSSNEDHPCPRRPIGKRHPRGGKIPVEWWRREGGDPMCSMFERGMPMVRQSYIPGG